MQIIMTHQVERKEGNFWQNLIVEEQFNNKYLKCFWHEQEWVEEPGYTEVNPGGTVILPCTVSNKERDIYHKLGPWWIYY